MKSLFNLPYIPPVVCCFAPSRLHSMSVLISYAIRSGRTALHVLQPVDAGDDPTQRPFDPSKTVPVDVPVKEPTDVPVPEPTDMPPPEPRDVPPAKPGPGRRDKFDPKPRPVP